MRYDVHYFNPSLGDDYGYSGMTPLPDVETFDACYRYVGTFEADDPDALFELLQDGGGGLGDETMQHYVLRHVLHTSMSLGDVAIQRTNGRLFQLQLEGWHELDFAMPIEEDEDWREGANADEIYAVGTIFVHYHPMSPPQWGMAPMLPNYSVYRNVFDALAAFKRFRLKDQRARDEPFPIFYRGQTDSRARLLPTRLRAAALTSTLEPKYGILDPTLPKQARDEIRKVQGEWARDERPMRSAEEHAQLLSEERVRWFDEAERSATEEATRRSPSVAALDPFRRRAAVRHYTELASGLLDITEDPDVAAYFASAGAKASGEECYGAIWAIDLNNLARFFNVERSEIPGGEKFTFTDRVAKWGDNRTWFEERGLVPVTFEIRNVTLPLARPTAQKGRFLNISAGDGSPLPLLAEVTWWSLIERWSYMAAFVQTGVTYENSTGVTERELFPLDAEHESLVSLSF